jgi:hypothetical protein
MRRLYITLPLLALLIAGSVLSFNKFASAQDASQGLEVSPPSQEVTIDPGKTITVKAKLRNKSNNTLPIQVHIEDFTAKGDEGQIELNANSPYSIASWATLTPTTFQLGAGETKEVTATIKAPDKAAGGHFGSFVFGIQPEKAKGNTAAVSQEIASLFLVKVSGPVSESMIIKEFKAPDFSEFGPVPFSIKFANGGNVYLKTYGLINVTDMFGKKVADIVVPGTNVFPGAERVVPSSLNKHFLFGTYTATALMYYGSVQTQSLTATTTFFVFPTRIAVGIVIILFVLFLLRKRLKKASKALFGK